jgi:hypothetical protein
MIRKKMLSPLIIVAALVAIPAWGADKDVVVAAPADSVAQNQKPDRVADVSPPPPPARHEQSNDRPAPRHERRLSNPSNPLGAYSKVNPLEPSPG